jgi:hypothetical protein
MIQHQQQTCQYMCEQVEVLVSVILNIIVHQYNQSTDFMQFSRHKVCKFGKPQVKIGQQSIHVLTN